MEPKKVFSFFIFFFLFFSPFNVFALQPKDVLCKTIDEIFETLNDSAYEAPDLNELKQEKLWKTIEGAFDFTLMTKLALGKYRKTFSEKQLCELTDYFGKLLRNIYLEKIESGSKDKIVYLDQEMVSEKKARVHTKVLREAGDIPLNYSMRKTKDGWKIYDVNVEGVSLVKNYRKQFGDLLFNKTPDQLIKKMKKKVEKQDIENPKGRMSD